MSGEKNEGRIYDLPFLFIFGSTLSNVVATNHECHHFTLTRMVIIKKKKKTITGVGLKAEKLEPAYIAGLNIK